MTSSRPARRRRWATVGLLMLLAGAPLACKKAAPSGEADARVFLSAPPEIKSAWDEALEAGRTNAPAAFSVLRHLRQQPGVTPDQQKAIDAQCKSIILGLAAAASKGDKDASQALLEIRKSTRGRRY